MNSFLELYNDLETFKETFNTRVVLEDLHILSQNLEIEKYANKDVVEGILYALEHLELAINGKYKILYTMCYNIYIALSIVPDLNLDLDSSLKERLGDYKYYFETWIDSKASLVNI